MLRYTLCHFSPGRVYFKTAEYKLETRKMVTSILLQTMPEFNLDIEVGTSPAVSR